ICVRRDTHFSDFTPVRGARRGPDGPSDCFLAGSAWDVVSKVAVHGRGGDQHTKRARPWPGLASLVERQGDEAATTPRSGWAPWHPRNRESGLAGEFLHWLSASKWPSFPAGHRDPAARA